jgi:hypothetical protein
MLAGVLSSPMGILGALGVGAVAAGVAAAFSRKLESSRSGLAVRSLSGNALVKDDTTRGFNRLERYERGLSIAGAAGRDLTDESLTKFVDSSEKMQRAFGISGEQYAGAMGAARKTGVANQDKFISGVIGDAVANKLSGSAVGEYLAQMTGYMESMSKGVDIDDKSLRGMAGALGSMEFFKKDPAKIFDALRGIESAFKDNDPYMQYLTYRSIQDASSGPISPSGVELRRDMGLFGNKLDDDTKKRLEDMDPELAKIFSIGGKDQVNARARLAGSQAYGKGTEGMDPAQRLLQFSKAMGMTPTQALPIMMDYRDADSAGKDMKKWGMGKGSWDNYEKGNKTADQRMADAMSTFEGSTVIVGAWVDALADAVSDFIAEGVTKFAFWAERLLNQGSSEPMGSVNLGLGENIDNLAGAVEGGDGRYRGGGAGRGGKNRKSFGEWISSDWSLPYSSSSSSPSSSKSVNALPSNVIPMMSPELQEKNRIKEEVKQKAKETLDGVRSSTSNLSPEDFKLVALKDNTEALKRLTNAIYGVKIVAGGRN